MLDYFDNVDAVDLHEGQGATAAHDDGDQRQGQRHHRFAQGKINGKRQHRAHRHEHELLESERPHHLGLHLDELRNGEIHKSVKRKVKSAK